MSALLRAVAATPRPEGPAPSAAARGGAAADPPRLSSNKALTYALSGIRARYASSQGQLRDVFREWDTDKSGSVDAAELRAALAGLGFSAVTEADASALIANIDLNGDGAIQYDDFVRLVCAPRDGAVGTGPRPAVAHPADLAAIGRDSTPADLNLVGRLFSIGGVLHKRRVAASEVAAARASTTADVAAGVGGDALREAVAAADDDAVAAVRAAFASQLGARDGAGRAARRAEVTPGERAAVDALAAADGARPALQPLAVSARPLETVARAALPPAVQIAELTARGFLARAPPRAAAPPAPAWWGDTAAAAAAGPLAASSFQNETSQRAKELAEASVMPAAPVSRAAARAAAAGDDAPPLPDEFLLPTSPLARTRALERRRRAHAPLAAAQRDDALTLPAEAASPLRHSATTAWDSPLALTTTARGDGALGGTLDPHVLGVVGPAGGGGRASPPEGAARAPPPNALDRSLHARARLPARTERVEGALSSPGGALPRADPRAQHPDGGPQALVVGTLGTRTESVAANGALTRVPAAERVIAAATARLYLTGRDHVVLPARGVPTAESVLGGAAGGAAGGGGGAPLASPLRVASHEARREAFFARAAAEAEAAGGAPPPRRATVPAPGAPSTRDALLSARATISARFAGVFGAEAAGAGAGADAGGALGSIASVPESVARGGPRERALAAAVRAEGARTTFLIAPPPSERNEFSPEAPAYHYASAAALAGARAPVPEQQLERLARADRLAGLTEQDAALRAAWRATHERDAIFEAADAAQRVQRLRDERAAYAAAVYARKAGREAALCMPVSRRGAGAALREGRSAALTPHAASPFPPLPLARAVPRARSQSLSIVRRHAPR